MVKQNDFISIYLKWLQENISGVRINENVYRVTTPFLDRNNDYSEIYIIKTDDSNYTITDDGNTINELELSGIDIFSTPKRKDILNTILNSHGVYLGENNELNINCDISTLALKKHLLLQCMLKISDLFTLSKPTVKSLFTEDVQMFLENNDVRIMTNISYIGKSNLITNYDFAIGKYKNIPERIIKAVNNLDTNTSKAIIFSWNDTKEARKEEMILYTFINDFDKKVSENSIMALKKYNIKPVLWTEKDKYIDELIA